jgi:hypothetical protein
MVTSEERLKVLKMIEEGAISVEDGQQLLATLSSQSSAKRRFRTTPGSPKDPRMLRVRVDDSIGKLKVNVVLPMALVNAGLNIASNFIEDLSNQHAIDLTEAIQSGETGQILDYFDEPDGEHVQVFIE